MTRGLSCLVNGKSSGRPAHPRARQEFVATSEILNGASEAPRKGSTEGSSVPRLGLSWHSESRSEDLRQLASAPEKISSLREGCPTFRVPLRCVEVAHWKSSALGCF